MSIRIYLPRLLIEFWGGVVLPILKDSGLTDIEKALVEDFNLIILEEWCKQWNSVKKLNPVVIGTETTGKFLQTSPLMQ